MTDPTDPTEAADPAEAPQSRTAPTLTPDPVEEWTRARLRVADLVTRTDPAAWELRVPACPDWTARDLLSHMVGLGADVAGGDEPDDHNDTWTARQVAHRRGRTPAELLAEWETVAPALCAWMTAHGPRPLNDMIIHEQDLRGALRVPGAQDTPALRTLRDTFAGRLRDRTAGLPPLALVGTHWRWATSGPPDGAAVVLTAPDFDLTRALFARRSASQLRRWTSQGDIEPYLEGFTALGGLPARDLSES
ncbi:maleylpyruvate isomerase family mycothiol-dependent enzyme [Streptomyces sp. J2-1]|uniref:maleylpyruvate isomerase family mycothiol-dependent enzyme n=1 Tax=Streptomyces corallincola TaxID=2851888 RepID=UPI001C386BE1|nr:maleylpyruvate isomerase family mycothiol-dependent enzyme [Streptomyces corallincola]MBV2357055.1 maleylpyruvate isomerase family mycothiol-dependent enzyme [Streptomyces corallincola]